MIRASKGAPGAIQVADRFHILRNLGDALGKVFQRHAPVLKEVLAASTQNNDHCSALPRAPSAAEKEVLQAPVSCLPSEAEQGRKTQRQLRYEEVRLLARAWLVTISAISRKTGLDRKTVRKYTQTEKLPERTARPKCASLLDPFREYLQERIALGCHNAARLFREIEKLDYKGKATLVRDYVADYLTHLNPGYKRRRKANCQNSAALPLASNETKPLSLPRFPSLGPTDPLRHRARNSNWSKGKCAVAPNSTSYASVCSIAFKR